MFSSTALCRLLFYGLPSLSSLQCEQQDHGHNKQSYQRDRSREAFFAGQSNIPVFFHSVVELFQSLTAEVIGFTQRREDAELFDRLRAFLDQFFRVRRKSIDSTPNVLSIQSFGTASDKTP